MNEEDNHAKAIDMMKRSHDVTRGIPDRIDNRIYHLLMQGGYVRDDRQVDWARVHAAVKDGSIWSVRNMGKTSVLKICKQLVDLGNE